MATTGVASLGAMDAAAADGSTDQADGCADLPRQGPKEVVRGKRAVASSQHQIVTETMLDVLKSGGNAVDAAMAGAITQATVQLDMTNHSGSVTFLYWEAKTGKTYQLDGCGTHVPHLAPFRPMPLDLDGIGTGPSALIPGFMPGVSAIHSRFGTKPWKALVEHAIPWAEHGRPMDEFTRHVLGGQLPFLSYFPSSRELYFPDGFLPSVGELWRNPALAKTLRRLADEGPISPRASGRSTSSRPPTRWDGPSSLTI